MKSIKNTITGLFILGGFVALLNLLHAQEAAVPDSIVQVTAEGRDLQRVSFGDLPPCGTFWLINSNGILSPDPIPVFDPSFPVYQISESENVYLVDASAGLVATDPELLATMSQSEAVNASLEAMAANVISLIDLVQGAVASRALRARLGMVNEMDEESGDGFTPLLLLDTNSLWLEITNYTPSLACLNLHNATNAGGVYAILSTTNLATPFAGWTMERELWPVGEQTNVLPFTIATEGRQNLFARAEDITKKDSDLDGVPDWFAWLYWHTTNLPDTNLDYSGSGNTFAWDYSNNVTPTVFQFTGIAVTNNYVSNMTVPVQLNVAGTPYYLAISLDDTNYAAAANWQTYASSNLTANLGLTEGWHDVWIGLRGHADEASSAVWQWKRLKLDWTPPALIITNPASGTVDVSMIQLQGFSPEALASISYDISNAVGTATNQQALIIGQTYSTNTMEFTTNYFQCYDVPLTTGTNTITLHAMDLAGNVTALTTNIVYIASTNPPTVGLLWPADGMQMAGGSVTIQGQVNDPTATVSVTVADAGGNTNSFNGRTGRDGVFWIENVELASGTNFLAVTLSTAAGDTTTNLNLLRDDTGLTVSPVAAGDTLVSGTIGTNGYAVWVNGVQATNNGDGTWTAQITPLCVGGGLVAVTAIPNSDNGGNGSGGGEGINPSSTQSLNTQATVQPPQGTFISKYHMDQQVGFYPGGEVEASSTTMNWGDGAGGNFYALISNPDYVPVGFQIEYDSIWPLDSWPQPLPDGTNTGIGWNFDSVPYTNSYASGPPELSQEHCDIAWHDDSQSGKRKADTEMRLVTGGPLGSTQKNLWVISASATAYTSLEETAGPPIPYDQIAIGGLGHLDTNGLLYVLLPDGDPIVTPTVLGFSFFGFGVGATKYPLAIRANNDIVLSNDVVVAGADFCVGQGITFDIVGLPSTVYDVKAVWTLPGTFVNTNSDPDCDLFYEENAAFLQPPQGTTATHCWYVKDDQPLTAKVHVFYRLKENGILFDQTITGLFNVHRPMTAQAAPYQPDGTPTAEILSGTLSLGVSGVTNDMSFSHTITTDGFTGGQLGYMQLIEGAGNGTIGYTSPSAPYFGSFVPINDIELDNYAPTRGPFSISANTNSTVVFQDAPAAGMYQGNARMNVEFSNYLMFNPNTAGSIWVPLRLITWQFNDEAGNYSIMSGWNATITSDAESTAFPDWKKTFGNSGF